MKAIRITAGTFGWNHGKYELIQAGDPPIEVEDALAARLVEKGVAEYVTPSSEVQQETGIEGMSAKELRELGKQYGLTFPARSQKADMVAAILAEQSQESDEAPEFDATEAVQ